MPPRAFRSALVLALSLAAALAAHACSGDSDSPPTNTTTSMGGAGGSDGGAAGAGGDPGSTLCADLGLDARLFSPGPYGTHRGDIAADFSLELADGTSFQFAERFTGCESYVFTPDVLPVSDLDATPVWESAADLAKLVEKSPKNVHFFFVSRKTTDALALPNIEGMQSRVEALLATLGPDDAAHWAGHLHVVANKALDLGDWVGDVLSTHGRVGFAIDRRQIIRGAGHLADVTRFDSALDAAGKWPWKSNLAYLAHDPLYFNAQAELLDRVDAEGATVVDLWNGEVLAEFADTLATLPSAAEMASFDSLEVEVTQQCPDPDDIELGNCGAWDYIARLYLADDPNALVEIARFITSYHRETHWVVDASDLLPLLATGGDHAFRWSFAPSWNTQPTATKLSLRFSNQAKAARPVSATYLFSGGAFDANYNTARPPVDVPIPSTAQKVELFVIVTGHGADSHQCAEFCNHQHEFVVGGTTYLQTFPMAGTSTQCMPNMEHGMTPNQAGTWWFGRGGWCPGQQVDPWIVDVTADVTPGQTATVSYRGLFGGNDPPADGGGTIDLVSYLVISE